MDVVEKAKAGAGGRSVPSTDVIDAYTLPSQFSDFVVEAETDLRSVVQYVFDGV